MTRRKDNVLDWLGLGNGGTELPRTRPDLAETFHCEEALLAALAALTPLADPPDDLLAGIEAKIDALPAGEFTTQRADEGSWTQLTDKIWRKVLKRYPESGRGIYLLRCEPGAVLPAHRHEHDEHVFVIEGEYLVDDTLIRAGDSQFAKAGSLHAEIRSETGCLVLIHA